MSKYITILCPYCARDLEGAELITGLCASDDCPRHDDTPLEKNDEQ